MTKRISNSGSGLLVAGGEAPGAVLTSAIFRFRALSRNPRLPHDLGRKSDGYPTDLERISAGSPPDHDGSYEGYPPDFGAGIIVLNTL